MAVYAKRWVVLVTVAMALVLITLDNTILYTALPTLTLELGANQTQSLWIINAYPLVMAGLLLGAGTLGDRIGHRTMFLIGLVLFGLASLAAAFSASAAMLIATRALLAVGAAAMMPATLALIRVSFSDERERNLAIAVWGALAIAGAGVGPIVGGFLLEHFWWGSVFLINVPVVIVTFISAWYVAPVVVPDRSKQWDLISSLQALVVLSALVFAIKELTHAGTNYMLIAVMLVVAGAGGVLFMRRQATIAQPLLDMALFRNPAFLAGVLSAIFTLVAIGGIQLATTQRFQLVAGFSPMEAGLFVSALSLGALPTSLLGGAYLHRVGLLFLIAGGLGLGALAVLFTAYGLNHDLGLNWLVLGMMLTGAGLGASMSVASTAIIGNAPVHRAGMAASIEEVSYEFGSLLAVALLGGLLSSLYSLWATFPAEVPAAARDSITAAHQLGEVATRQANAAFDRSYVAVMYVISGILALGSAVTGVLLRTYRPGTASSCYQTH